MSNAKKNISKRSNKVRQLPPLNLIRRPQNSEIQHFPLPVLPRPGIPVGESLVHFVEQWGN